MIFEAGNSAKKADGTHELRDILHRAPYVKVQRKSEKLYRVPLAGNLALDE